MASTGLIIQKYGGATLATPAHIRSAAQRISHLRRQGYQVVAIVSAMGQTTNELIRLAHQVSDHPSLRELDMLLTTGERVSMALLSMALQDLGVDSISFTGSQAGILTDESHVTANIIDVKAYRVTEALNQNKVVVLAGFQGVSPVSKEITTLGRGGTDTTAVAMAVYLEADRCEILKEVPAVFTADPRLVLTARPLRHLTYEQLADMCFWGAKVLHYRSVELAARNQIPLYVGPAKEDPGGNDGTTLNPETGKEMRNKMFESSQILALNSHEKVVKFSHAGSMADAFHFLQNLLLQQQIPAPQILSSSTNATSSEIVLTGPSEVVEQIERALSSQKQVWQGDLATVTCTCSGSTSLGLYGMVTDELAKNGLKPLSVSLTAQSLTMIIPRSERTSYLTRLHTLIPNPA